MDLIARRTFVYRGTRRRAGQTVDASRRDARLLIAIGYAAEPDAQLDSEPEPAPEPAPPPIAKRTYRRRDMRAESGGE